MEIWDAYDKNGVKVGVDLIRGEQIPDGLYHLVSEIILRHTDGSFLAMQRDFAKPNYPGLFEITAGGSALKDETPIDGAKRELFEETGIRCSEIEEVYRLCDDNNQCIYYGYYCVTDYDKASVKLQRGETVSYRWIDENDVVDFINSSEPDIHRKRILPIIEKLLTDNRSKI